MPVATVPSYEEMWVDPQVVAALSNGVFVYTDYDPWADDVAYARSESVLYGPDAPFGGYVWTATGNIPAGALPPGEHPAWLLDQEATGQRLRLFSATTQATWLLDTLTGYTLHGIECWAEDYQAPTCTIRLRRSPVTAVHSVIRVTRCNVAGSEVGNWCWKSQQQISLCCTGGQAIDFWPGYIGWPDYPFRSYDCDNVVRVLYTIGSNLPPGSEALAAWLAVEYGKAAAGTPCALPERITSVTRQGVTWTMLDPQTFLDKGFTGMARIDHWLAAVKSTVGGILIDPLTSTRLFTHRVDCADIPVPTPT
jgi:hypothetical protein